MGGGRSQGGGAGAVQPQQVAHIIRLRLGDVAALKEKNDGKRQEEDTYETPKRQTSLLLEGD